MKKITLTFLFFQLYTAGFSQVGIGTTSPVASAKLQVDAPDKGFLPPRVALQGTDDATKTIPKIASPATGLLVYNTATAGSGATAVTPGVYYYDGAKWQRVINQQPDATVTFNGTNPNSGTGFSGTQQSTDFVYVSNDNASQWIWNPAATPNPAYVTYTPPASTPWYAAGGTTDAGSNKTGSVYRSGKVGIGGSNTPIATLDVRSSPSSTSDPGTGFIGVGTTTATVSSAGAGAIRYNPTTGGGVLQYSSGTGEWNTLTSTVQRTIVTGYFLGSSESTPPSYTSAIQTVLSCAEVSDVSNAFSSNTFTAPRESLYLVTANLLISSRAWTAGQELNITLVVGNDLSTLSAQVISSNFMQSNITSFAGTTISAVIKMNANQKAQFHVFVSGSGTYSLYSTNYNRFSITEL
jgi:hypothetical protein